MMRNATNLLDTLLEQRLPPDQYHWLQERLSLIKEDDNQRHIHISFGSIPRRLGKQDLHATSQEQAQAENIASGWYLGDWSIDITARVLLLSTIAKQENHDFGELFKTMCQSADLGETLALYKGIALFPPSKALDRQIGEGLRTHIRVVFESIAHHNPYPAANFSQLRWNHMVLKALFVDSTLYPIQGLDARANPELARILCDYAHERWAAGRPITPELWRCVGPFADESMLKDLNRAISSGDPLEQAGAALALFQCPHAHASAILANYPDLSQMVASGELTWDAIHYRRLVGNP